MKAARFEGCVALAPDRLRSIDLVLRSHVVPVRGFLEANELDLKFHFLALRHFLPPALGSEQCYHLLNTFIFLFQLSTICHLLLSDLELHGAPEDDENAQR